MAAHFVKQCRPKDIIPPIKSAKTPYNSRTPVNYLSRPHVTGLEQPIATSGELAVLFLAMAVLVAVVAWLGWIVLGTCMKLVKDRIDEVSLRERARLEEECAERVPRFFSHMGMDVERGLRSMILGRKTGGNGDVERGRSEHSGLLSAFEGRSQGYGYRYGRGDGTSDSASSGRTTVIHRDDCEGQCGMQPRRRSAE